MNRFDQVRKESNRAAKKAKDLHIIALPSGPYYCYPAQKSSVAEKYCRVQQRAKLVEAVIPEECRTDLENAFFRSFNESIFISADKEAPQEPDSQVTSDRAIESQSLTPEDTKAVGAITSDPSQVVAEEPCGQSTLLFYHVPPVDKNTIPYKRHTDPVKPLIPDRSLSYRQKGLVHVIVRKEAVATSKERDNQKRCDLLSSLVKNETQRLEDQADQHILIGDVMFYQLDRPTCSPEGAKRSLAISNVEMSAEADKSDVVRKDAQGRGARQTPQNNNQARAEPTEDEWELIRACGRSGRAIGLPPCREEAARISESPIGQIPKFAAMKAIGSTSLKNPYLPTCHKVAMVVTKESRQWLLHIIYIDGDTNRRVVISAALGDAKNLHNAGHLMHNLNEAIRFVEREFDIECWQLVDILG